MASQACSSGISLAGDQDVQDGDAAPDLDSTAEVDETTDDGGTPPDGSPDRPSDAEDAHETGDVEDSADDADRPDGVLDADDAGEADSPPDGGSARLVPDETEMFFDFGDSPSWRDSVTPMHRHSLPVAWSGSSYAVLLEDRSETDGAAGPIAVFRFQYGVDGLHEVWVDEEPGVTEYNSICWTGSAFVAALPTIDVGLRIVSLDETGVALHPARTLEPSSTYVPAEHGEPPVVLCPGSGAFVLDPGRGAGGLDRLYEISPDGAYTGTFVDADIPTFARNLYYSPIPCTTAGSDASCATGVGLAFLRRDGTVRSSDPLPAPGVCGGPAGCDVASTGADVFAVGSVETMWPDVDLQVARWDSSGALRLPPVSLGSPGEPGPESLALRIAAGDWTALVATFGESFGPGPVAVRLVGLDGSVMDAVPSAVTCVDFMSCMGHTYVGGGAVVWDGDAYAALWTTGRGVAVRRFAVEWSE